MVNNIGIKKHSGIKTIILHLLPGLLNLLAILLLLPLALHFGFYQLTAGYFMIIIAMIPFQIGFLLYTAKKTTGTYNIGKLIPFQKKSNGIEYIIFVVIIAAWAIFTGRILEPLEMNVRDSIFAFVPDAIAFRNTDFTQFSKSGLLFTAIFGIFANGILAPITEELYFRGYLLPRINLSPKWSAVASATLFSLYHLFSPWQFFSRLLMMIPIYLWVVKRQNIRFSIIAHLIANLYTNIGMLIIVLSL